MKHQKTTRIVSLVLIFVVAISLVVVSPRSAQAYAQTDAPTYVSQLGSAGTGDGQFNTPYGIAVDSHDNLYVADRVNNRVQKFDANGNFLMKFGSAGSGNGQLSGPRGIDVDASGNIYIADTSNHRVQKFDANGTFITKWGSNGTGNGQFSFPNDIAIDTAGNVYTTELGARVQKFDANGNFLMKFGSAGSGNGQFSGLASIIIDPNGNILVVDGNNARVQKFDSSGTFVSKFGSFGFGDGQFNNPNAGYMVLDVYGNIYVTDTYSSRVEKFTSSGSYLAKFGSFGTGNGQYDRTTGMAIDSTGAIYVVDFGHSRIQKYAYPPTEAPVTGTDAVIDVPSMVGVTSSQAVAENALQGQDASNTYPLGLVDFRLTVPSGSTNVVSLTFETDLLPSAVTARKYKTSTKSYLTVPGAVITETTLNGHHALKVTYSITDGGVLDDDGIVNGVVVDPVGLAVASTPATEAALLADTGLGNNQSLLIIDVLAGFGLMATVLVARRAQRYR